MKHIILLLISLGWCAITIHAQERNNEVSFISNNKRKPDKSYQEQLRNSIEWQHFLKANDQWYVVYNEENQKPHKAYGAPIPTVGTSIEERAWNFITIQLKDFSIPVSDLVFQTKAESKKHVYVHYFQTYKGLKILNSHLEIKMNKNAEVILFALDVFNTISIDSTPSISREDAIAAAVGNLDAKIISREICPEHYILPIPEEGKKKYQYKLVFEILVKAILDNGMPATYKTYVDAHSGILLYRQNLIHNAGGNSTININGTVTTDTPIKGNTNVNLTDLRVVIDTSVFYTDSVGNIHTTLVGNSSSATFYMDGYWANIHNVQTNSDSYFTTTVDTGSNSISFDTNTNISERSAFYHVNIVHNHMKKYFSSFLGLDYPLLINVDDTSGSCNAYYNSMDSTLNFYLEKQCYALSQLRDVVYHEYGHAINDKFYLWNNSNFINGAMHEGYADIWALSITDNPIVGQGYLIGDSSSYVRRYDTNTKSYPDDISGEVHEDGEIIAGAWWDVYKNIGSMDTMMQLFTETFYALITGPSGTEGQLYTDILVEALQADDNDADISNGSPHDSAIVNAFAKHGLYLLSNSAIEHTPVELIDANIPITIDINLILSYSWLVNKVTLYYSLINDSSQWLSVEMLNTTANTYSAQIPAQPKGTIIQYYMALEDFTGNKYAVVEPLLANETNPGLPYFILSGYSQKHIEDFDSFYGSWETGSSTDNATSGMWTIGKPIGSFLNPFQSSSAYQPNYQYTNDGSKCAITANSLSPADPIGNADVDGGFTTLTSPNLDLSNYTNPAIEYYRWYINNPYSPSYSTNNYWDVEISDDGGLNWKRLEHTSISDNSWRRYSFRVLDYLSLTTNFKIRFIASDSSLFTNGIEDFVEAAIDNLGIYEESDSSSSLSIQELMSSTINLFPNPTSNIVWLEFNEEPIENMTIKIFNSIGNEMYTKEKISSGNHKILFDVSSYAQGIYILTVSTQKETITKKFSVAK